MENQSSGFIKLPIDLAEALSTRTLSAYEFRVIFFLLRKTYGWHKDNDRIPLSEFSRATGLSRSNAYRALKNLQERGIIVLSTEYKRKPKYGFQRNIRKWKRTSKHVLSTEYKKEASRRKQKHFLKTKGIEEQMPEGEGSIAVLSTEYKLYSPRSTNLSSPGSKKVTGNENRLRSSEEVKIQKETTQKKTKRQPFKKGKEPQKQRSANLRIPLKGLQPPSPPKKDKQEGRLTVEKIHAFRESLPTSKDDGKQKPNRFLDAIK